MKSIDFDEIPNTVATTTDAARILGVSTWYMSAVKKAMGIRSQRVNTRDVADWLRENPDFTTTSYAFPDRAGEVQATGGVDE